MQHTRSSWLSVFLAFVLLATSNGLAFAAASHDHNAAHTIVASSMATEHDHSHHAHQASITSEQEQATISDSAQDCVCDEICCVSYASFATSNSHTIAVLHDSHSPMSFAHYQSIALDLYIPPPKA